MCSLPTAPVPLLREEETPSGPESLGLLYDVVLAEGPDYLLPFAALMPCDHEEVVRLGSHGLPFGELDFDPSEAILGGAFAKERHVRPVGDVVLDGVVEAFVPFAEKLLVFLPASVPGAHAVDTCPQR